MAGRDDFSQKTKEELAEAAGYRCQSCGKYSKGDGQAAHIKAASKGGPRFDPSMSKAERRDISNALFLCAECHFKVDNNPGSNQEKKLENMKHH